MTTPVFEPRVAPPKPVTEREFGDGVLGRGANVVYWYIVVALLIMLASLPTLAVTAVLARTADNAPLFAAAMLPVAPAFFAGVSALARRTHDAEATPWRSFWRGYRGCVADVLKLWTPFLVLAGVVATIIAHRADANVSLGYAVVLLVIVAFAFVVVVHAMTIATFFGFRFSDLLRLGVIHLARRPLASLGVLSFAVLAGALLVVATEVPVVLLASVWAALVLRNERPVLRSVAKDFVTPTPS